MGSGKNKIKLVFRSLLLNLPPKFRHIQAICYGINRLYNHYICFYYSSCPFIFLKKQCSEMGNFDKLRVRQLGFDILAPSRNSCGLSQVSWLSISAKSQPRDSVSSSMKSIKAMTSHMYQRKINKLQ